MAYTNEVREIDGVWNVKVRSGPFWFRSLNMIRDRKYIEFGCGINDAKIVGEWGVFRVEKIDGRTFTFTYLDSPIVDRVRIVTRNILFGEFYWKGKFVGFFHMKRAVFNLDKDLAEN